MQIDDEAVRALIAARPDPFVLIDARYRIVAANQRYAALYGLTPTQVEGFHCHEVSHHRATPCHEHGEACPLQTVTASGEPTEVVHVHHGCGGRQDVVRILGYPIRLGGQLLLGESIEPLGAIPLATRASDEALLGTSPAFVTALAELARAARFALPILLLGETGVGKELAARHIHARSQRADRPFVTVDCATLPAALADDELFGHVRGAYSGAMGTRAGLFERAHGGTLLLDEVSSLAADVQAKLLRVLETGELRRLGEGSPKRVDVRVICATQEDLLGAVKAGRFRADLYYRMAGLKVTLPPLRERREDIGMLAGLFLEQFREQTGLVVCMSPEALEWLERQPWPGNVRELRQVMWRSAAQATDGLIDLPLLAALAAEPGRTTSKMQGRHAAERSTNPAVPDAVRLADILARHGGKRSAAARELGVAERTLYRWLSKARVGGPNNGPADAGLP